MLEAFLSHFFKRKPAEPEKFEDRLESVSKPDAMTVAERSAAAAEMRAKMPKPEGPVAQEQPRPTVVFSSKDLTPR